MCEKDKDAIAAGARGPGRKQSIMCKTKLPTDEDKGTGNGPGGAFLEKVATKSFPEETSENAAKELEASLSVDHTAGAACMVSFGPSTPESSALDNTNLRAACHNACLPPQFTAYKECTCSRGWVAFSTALCRISTAHHQDDSSSRACTIFCLYFAVTFTHPLCSFLRACVFPATLARTQEAPGGVAYHLPRQADEQSPTCNAGYGTIGWPPRRGAG